MKLARFFLLLTLLPCSFFLSANESFRLIKPFGFATSERSLSPALFLEIMSERTEPKGIFFKRSSRGDSILSFPQEEEWIIIPFENFFRKEIYKKPTQTIISQDFSLSLGDIISLYLYDNKRREWVNPLLGENLGKNASLTLKEMSLITQEGKKLALNARYPVSIPKGNLEILLNVSSEMQGKFKGSVGIYSLSVHINGEEWLSFFAQGIKESDNAFVWEGLDPRKGSYAQGQFKFKNPPLKVGTNEIRIEVKNFLYRSLVFRGFIKVLEPLVQ